MTKGGDWQGALGLLDEMQAKAQLCPAMGNQSVGPFVEMLLIWIFSSRVANDDTDLQTYPKEPLGRPDALFFAVSCGL